MAVAKDTDNVAAFSWRLKRFIAAEGRSRDIYYRYCAHAQAGRIMNVDEQVVAAGMCQQSLVGHAGPIFSLKWNKKGDLLLTGSLDRTAIVWNAKAGTIKQQFSFHSGEQPAVSNMQA